MIFPFHDDNPTRRPPVVTVALIALNVLIFLRMAMLPAGEQHRRYYALGFVPARLVQLFQPRLIAVDPQLVPPQFRVRVRTVWADHEVLRPMPAVYVLSSLLTCMFLHGGLAHLLGNMWFLWIFGNNVEDRLGHVPFLLFYLGGGVFASLCHWATNPLSTLPVIGASGAVSTILGAYAITWPAARVRSLVFLFIFITIIDVPAMIVLGVWFFAQLAGALGSSPINLGGGVAWWAHVGGFLAGLLLMPFLSPQHPAPVGAEDDLTPVPPEDELFGDENHFF